jgi:anaerobic selenocysteine-containing dehydrogenase
LEGEGANGAVLISPSLFRGRALVLVGPSLANAAALGVWINDRIGALVDGFDPDSEMSAAGALSDLASDIRASRVETLVILEGNPGAVAPGDLDFETLIARVPFRIHLGGYFDETAAASTWRLPAPHPLESWSDIATTDGVVSIVQPLIRPLHAAHSAHELLAALSGEAGQSDYDRIRAAAARSSKTDGAAR